MGIDGGRTDCLWLHTEANRGRDVGHNKRRNWIRGQVLGQVNGEHVGLGLRGDDNRGITISNRTNMNKQQTAVEWLLNEIWEHIEWKPQLEKRAIVMKFEQAKEMEKEQAIKLYYEYDLYLMMNESSVMTFGQFYKQTYGDDKQ